MPEPVQPFPRAVNTAGIDKYNKLLAFQQTPVYPGCQKIVLKSVMDVIKIKVVRTYPGFLLEIRNKPCGTHLKQNSTKVPCRTTLENG